MSAIISRTKAKRLTLVYQAAAVVCVLGGVAVGVIGLPESSAIAKINDVSQNPIPSNPVLPSGTTETTPTSTPPTFKARIEPAGIAARLSLLDNAPRVTSVPEVVTTEDNEVEYVEDSTEGMLAKRVRYTGYISDSNNPLAFIRIDGTQRIVPQGGIAQAGSMSMDDLTITTVRPQFIMVSDGNVEDRIMLADKIGSASTISSESIEAAPVRLTEADIVLTPEELASLEGLSPRERGLRERMLKRSKLGREVQQKPMEPLASFRAGLGARDRPANAQSENSRAQPNRND
ncbi:MAG: hypothetical protein JJ974_01300 [Phycisphaerales bacterium]|nr:hypothetical protein [Phycisphaerales bacterium]